MYTFLFFQIIGETLLGSQGNRKREPVLRKGVTEALKKLGNQEEEAEEGAWGKKSKNYSRERKNMPQFVL